LGLILAFLNTLKEVQKITFLQVPKYIEVDLDDEKREEFKNSQKMIA